MSPEQAEAAEASEQPLVVRRHRRRSRRVRRIALRALLAAGVLLLVLAAFAAWYALTLRSDYRETKADIDAARAMVPTAGSGERLHPEQLPELADRLAEVEAEIRHLDDRVHLPLVTAAARHLPWAGPRVRAAEQFLAFGESTVSLARDSAQLGRDIYDAWRQTGFNGPADPNAPTWLGVVRDNRAQIDELLARFDGVLAEREQLDEAHLPARATNMLATLDPLLDRAAETRDRYIGLLDYYPVVEEALGGEQDGRYLVLLLNSEEIRPTGGFPGTYAVITVRQGRLESYEFHNILDLDGLYYERRATPLPPPGPMREYLKIQEWLPRDSGWSADFPEAARTLLAMYAVAGEEPVNGVVAVTDVAVRDILRTLGPLTVTIEGESVTVDHDNVIDVIESYRAGAGERHKEAVRIIGTALLDRIRDGGFDLQKQVLASVRDSADRREIQLYAVDPSLQAEVVARGWDGALVPDPAVPTLGMTLANVVGNKASRNLFVSSQLRFRQTATGTTRVTWAIHIDNTGDPNGDTLYNGFHRTWLALYLPAGSTLVSSTPDPIPPPINDDPRALGYHLELLSGGSGDVSVTFDLPAGATSLRLRRQPGANDVGFDIGGDGAGCTFDTRLSLWRDEIVDLRGCTATRVTQPESAPSTGATRYGVVRRT